MNENLAPNYAADIAEVGASPTVARDPIIGKEAAMRFTNRCLLVTLSMTVAPIGVAVTPVASADCTNAGAATVCAQGTVRGGGPDAPQAGPVYPGYCADPWYCSDDWGVDVILDPGPPLIDIGRPGRPGGIGPR